MKKKERMHERTVHLSDTVELNQTRMKLTDTQPKEGCKTAHQNIVDAEHVQDACDSTSQQSNVVKKKRVNVLEIRKKSRKNSTKCVRDT